MYSSPHLNYFFCQHMLLVGRTYRDFLFVIRCISGVGHRMSCFMTAGMRMPKPTGLPTLFDFYYVVSVSRQILVNHF